MPRLTFLGAAGTVTGSKYLLEVGSRRILVDCGLFQGLKRLRDRNWRPLPIPPGEIDAMVLTHAHLDHCGYIPRAVANGFSGRIFCTPGTRDLCSLVLPDSARIQEEDARDANRYHYTKHNPALPLYTSEDAARALTLFQPVGYNRPIPIVPGVPDVEVEFIDAGHLLGSAYARVRFGDRSILFGGDLGRFGRPVLPDPTMIDEADVLLVESTYGDRQHEVDDNGVRLATVINETFQRGGKLIIPSFAIGRSSEVIYWLKRLEDEKRIPVLPVFVDSPMAASSLTFYASYPDDLDPDMRPATRNVRMFATKRMTTVSSPQQSKELVASRQPAIVIASSGMATGGRVLHHLEATLPSERNTVMFVGFQAEGTRGRQLVDGAREIRLKGRDIPVAARVEQIDSMSAHADAGEILHWLRGFKRPPSMTYLVHGEPPALNALAGRVGTELGWPVQVAEYEKQVEL
ncbi:MAG: MBL fold metallo-hydrolase RNA specificity domain-containing protein [Vicinamibacterales bacterium]